MKLERASLMRGNSTKAEGIKGTIVISNDSTKFPD